MAALFSGKGDPGWTFQQSSHDVLRDRFLVVAARSDRNSLCGLSARGAALGIESRLSGWLSLLLDRMVPDRAAAAHRAAAIDRFFRDVPNRLGDPAWLGLICLVLPVIGGYVFFFPAARRNATRSILLASVAHALINGVLEEVLWRGVYISIFPGQWLWGVVYPAIGFGLWHLAPQSIVPHTGGGGKFGFAFSAIFLGLAFGWVAMSTGTILWVSVAHVLMDFAGLGGRAYLDNHQVKPTM